MTIEFEKESKLEKFADSPATMVTTATLGALGGTLIGGLPGTVVGALLPVLANIPAFKRYKSRIDNTLVQIEQVLNQHDQQLANLSDAQFKMLNETILTLLQTLEEEKLDYLKFVICNTLECQDLTHHEAALLSRIIRDLSAAEAKFLVNSVDGREPFGEVIIYPGVQAEYVKEKALWLSPQSENTVLATGLINLGLLLPKGSGLGGSLSYRFSPVTKTLMNLLKSDSSSNLEDQGQVVAQVPDHPFFGMRANDSRSVTEIMRQLRGESAHDV